MPNPYSLRSKKIITPPTASEESKQATMLRNLTFDGTANSEDIFSNQSCAEDFLYAIEGLESSSGKIILFTNITSKLELNGLEVSTKFSNVIWVAGKKLILSMEGSRFSKDTTITADLTFKAGEILDAASIRKILMTKNIKYMEYKSASPQSLAETKTVDVPEIWFGRGSEVFIEAVANIENKEVNLYPNINGELVLYFYHNPTSCSIVDKRKLAGLMEFDNKILLAVVPNEKIQKLAKATAILNSRGLSVSSFEPLDYTPLTHKFYGVIGYLKKGGYDYHIISNDVPPFLQDEPGIGRGQ